MAETKKDGRQIALNRQARHNYFVEESFEAGIELAGTEVKSLRAGTVNMKDAWCQIRNGEMFVSGMHISPYEMGNIFNRDPMRDRKLLMHKREKSIAEKSENLAQCWFVIRWGRGRGRLRVGVDGHYCCTAVNVQ